ncbi:MAG: prolyl aminopeptidase [Alphaproteobacteria bacterium]|nr:prolyl aminopeptidase [Alphaproteobacteria bacterium]
MTAHDLFPPIEPYASGTVKVDDLHTIYWEESGNPKGMPVVFLHGGPGTGSTPAHRRFFDPHDWRIFIFDQRGAGRSRPLGETRANTTALLVQDIEKLRAMRGIDRWHVFGGSWGSTLALAYAQTHPERVLGLMLRGICLMRQQEVDWFIYGMRTIFPEAWRKFAAAVPEEERDDLLAAYDKIFRGGDEASRLHAIKAWSDYEIECSSLLPSADNLIIHNDNDYRIGMALIELHYFRNNLFVPEARLLDDIDKIRKIPGVIVQGRYDVICPIVTADALHERWPEADYRVIPDAGHSSLEPGIRAALIEATERFKTIGR